MAAERFVHRSKAETSLTIRRAGGERRFHHRVPCGCRSTPRCRRRANCCTAGSTPLSRRLPRPASRPAGSICLRRRQSRRPPRPSSNPRLGPGRGVGKSGRRPRSCPAWRLTIPDHLRLVEPHRPRPQRERRPRRDQPRPRRLRRHAPSRGSDSSICSTGMSSIETWRAPSMTTEVYRREPGARSRRSAGDASVRSWEGLPGDVSGLVLLQRRRAPRASQDVTGSAS